MTSILQQISLNLHKMRLMKGQIEPNIRKLKNSLDGGDFGGHLWSTVMLFAILDGEL